MQTGFEIEQRGTIMQTEFEDRILDLIMNSNNENDVRKIDIVEEACLLALMNVKGLGRASIRKLIYALGSARAVFNIPKTQLSLLSSDYSIISDSIMESLLKVTGSDNYMREYDDLVNSDIRFYSMFHPEYPSNLKNIPDNPIGIFVKGRLPHPDEKTISIVGTRRCTEYGRYMAREFTRELVRAGYGIVSGLAIGIDAVSQVTCLQENGLTYAILGCGVDICYPSMHIGIYNSIVESGGIISEYPIGTKPLPRNFPQRNRIISGLSTNALIVIEAGEKSGTLITTDSALEQGKDIYALPGRTTDVLSRGCNNLILQGAKMLSTPEALISELLTGEVVMDKQSIRTMNSTKVIDTARKNTKEITTEDGDDLHIMNSIKELTEIEQEILSVMDFTPLSIEELLYKINYNSLDEHTDITELMRNLTLLCIKSMVGEVGGCYYKCGRNNRI